MALSLSSYVEPGAYSTEVVVPTGINIPALPFAACLIGTGSRNARASSEAVLRGMVTDEALTLALVGGYRTATLVNRGDRKVTNTTVTRTLNGVEQDVPDQYVSYSPAVLQGLTSATFDLSSDNAFVLEMDGRPAITMRLSDDGAGATPVVTQLSAGSSQFTATWQLGGTGGNATTAAQIAQSINAVLFAATASALGTSTGYGTSYGAADGTTGVAEASTLANTVTITSPLSTSASDIRVSAAPANNASDTVFHGSGAKDASTIIRIDLAFYNASATWVADYVAIGTDTDDLANADVQAIVAVGATAGSNTFVDAVDYTQTSDTVDWSPDTAASFTGTAAATWDLDPNDSITLNIDGKGDLTIDLVAMASAPIGYTANPGGTAGDASTAANVVGNINAVLASRAIYGARYKAVASVFNTSYIKLTSPTQGRSSSIVIKAPASNSAVNTIFGTLAAASTTGGYRTLGTGKRPTDGTLYFVTYDYTRASTDYNVPFRHFSVDAAKAQVGPVSISTSGYNPLAIAAEIAFRNGAQFIYTIQVDDTTAEGNPTRQEILDALDGAKTTSGITEICIVGEPGTRLDTMVDVLDHLEAENAPLEKHPRRGWFGMPIDTAIGDTVTADTYVYAATQTLQVASASPARGRMFLMVPPQEAGISRDLTLEDGSTVRVSLDSTYLGVAAAARRTGLPKASDTLTRKNLSGFNTDDITAAWRPSEFRTLAGQGCFVVVYDAGRFVCLDAMSTEGGGGGLDAFKVDSTSYQKDVVKTKVDAALDANIVGLVPYDLANFLIEIKLIIQGVVSAEIANQTIGPFLDEDTGAIRAMDLRRDIQVVQSAASKTTWNYKYWYNLAMPALRVVGEYSVDQPFFGSAPS